MQLIAAERRGEEAKGSAAPLAIEGVCLGFEGIDLEINGGGDLIRVRSQTATCLELWVI